MIDCLPEELIKPKEKAPTKKKKTIRERHKLAPYLELKNSKRTSKCRAFFTVLKKPKTWTELAR